MANIPQQNSDAQSKSKPMRLTRTMRAIPTTAYQCPTDGKKWRHLCAERKQLADWLASYGDGDGSRIFPSVDTILRAFDTWSRAKLFRRLGELRELGVLKSEGLKGARGPRVRRLDPKVFEGDSSYTTSCNQAEVSDSKPEVSNRRAEVSPMRETHTVTLPTPDRHKQDSPELRKVTRKAVTPETLFAIFAEQYGFEFTDGMLGWITHRTMRRQRTTTPVLNALAYYRAAIRNFLEMDDGKQSAFVEEYSFCEFFGLKPVSSHR